MFEVGDRVKFSAEWTAMHDPAKRRGMPYAEMFGDVVGQSRAGGCVRVKWDALKDVASIHAAFLEWANPSEGDCKVCFMNCDPDIHAATVRVHKWFREFVTMDRRVKAGKVHVPEDS